jgi:predicted MFS family arabinose efflux permease
MTGIVVSGAGIGMLIAPPVASRLVSIYDWRTSYIIVGIVVLVVIVLAAQFLRKNPAYKGQMPDGDNNREEPGLKLKIGGFSLTEAFRTRQFWMIIAMFFCSGYGTMTIMVHIVPHTTDLGISVNNAAIVMAIIGGVNIAGTLVLGRAADSIGNRQVFIIGFFMKSAILFWLVISTDVWMLYLFAIIFGISQGTAAAESPLVAWLFGLRSHGLILGTVEIGFTAGAAIGPWLSGYIFDVTNSYQIAFLACAGTSIAALVLSILLRPVKEQQLK